MIYTAILVACLASAPTECKRHEFLIMGNGIPYAPVIEAQARAAQWLKDHPGYEMRGNVVVRPGRSA